MHTRSPDLAPILRQPMRLEFTPMEKFKERLEVDIRAAREHQAVWGSLVHFKLEEH